MRYNRSTREIELTVFDLCGHSSDRDIAYNFAEASGFAKASELVLDVLDFRYNYENIDYLIKTGAFIHQDSVCEIIVDNGQKASIPLLGETCVFAYALCEKQGRADISIKSVYINSETMSYSVKVRRKTTKALEAYFLRKLAEKAPVASMLKQRAETVLTQCAQVKFPYATLRRGQKIMMKECYDAIKSGSRLFVQAPTGIGKTISTLYPAVMQLGKGKCDKIFYLTAKGSNQSEVFRTAGALFEAGANLRTIIIAAKDHMCLSRELMCEGLCDSRHCKYSDCTEEKLAGAVNTLLALQNGYEPTVISKIADEWKVCPYELSLSLAEYCEIIIADYNYVFDPLVYLRRFFDENQRTDKYVFLIDEAHNLADRARDMYSVEMSYDKFYRFRCEIESELPELISYVDGVLRQVRNLKALCADNTFYDEQKDVERGFYLSHDRCESLDIALEGLSEKMMRLVRKSASKPYYNSMADLLRSMRRYIVISELCSDSSVFYCETEGDKIRFKTLCVDPAKVIDMRMSRAHASVLFSATLTPLNYFVDILGGGAKSSCLSLKSPFDENNLFLAAIDNVSTRFEDREKSLNKVVTNIAATVSCRKGNYMVYLPSYQYMTQVCELFQRKYPGVQTLMQRKGMTRREKEDYLNEFKLNDGKMRVGFCVLGGGFSEGIDLPGSSLIGVVVVGVGTPGISGERNIIRDHFDLVRDSGYLYAYTYPGMNNVLQAAGRVIRSEKDCGVVVLIDDRYNTPQYKAMYPEHWHKMKHFGQSISLNASIKEFWRKKDEKNANKSD